MREHRPPMTPERGAQIRQWRESNPEKVRAYGRAYHHRNAEERNAPRRSNDRHPRPENIKRLYGLTVEAWLALHQEQSGLCGICKKPPAKGHLHVDHDHDTGRVRGLLCRPCNVKLHALEKRDWRAAADAYLARFEERTWL